MLRYLVRRFGQSLIALAVITVLVFALSQLTGDPTDALLPMDASPEQRQNIIEHWGLDRPLHEQYFTFVGNALQGDFGESMKWRGQPALDVVLQHLPATLQLGGFAVLITVIAAIPLGVIAARNRGTWVDSGANIFALLGQALPPFWLGLILIWIFAVWLGWLPTSGYGGLAHMILPGFAMAWFQIAALTRLTRSSMLDVMDTEYIKLARTKGLPDSAIVWKHALRNAAIVPLTFFGVLAGNILKGSIVIETVFAWPGTGWLALEAIKGRDFPVIQTTVLLFAIIYLVLNFLIDVLYAVIDPRIRTG